MAELHTSQYIRAAQKPQIDALQPSRRRRVEPDPNAVFVNTHWIHRAQIAARRIEGAAVGQGNCESVDSRGWFIHCG